MAKNMMAKLTQELIEKVGSEDVAKNIIEGMRMQKDASRSTIQKQLRTLIKNIDTDDITRKTAYLDQFTTNKEGQVVFKDINMPERPRIEPEIPNVQKDVPGQMSMFQDSTGEMTTSSLKTKEIKEARQARQKSKREQEYTKNNFAENDDGQMSFDFGDTEPKPAPKDTPEPDPNRKLTPEEEYEKKIDDLKKKAEKAKPVEEEPAMTETSGQQHFINSDDGLSYADDINRREGRAQRAAQMEEGEKNFFQKGLDKTKELGTRAVEAITGEGEDVSRFFGGRKARNEQRMAANNTWLETGKGSYQTKKQYYESVKDNKLNKSAQNQKVYQDIVTGENFNSAQAVAQSISQTAPLDNSGGLPTWGKVSLGIAGGVLAGSLLDGE